MRAALDPDHRPGAIRPAPAWAYAAAIVGTLLAGRVLGSSIDLDASPSSLDGRSARWLAANRVDYPRSTAAALAITTLGNPPVATAWVVALGLSTCLLRRRGLLGGRRGDGLFLMLVPAVGQLMNWTLKAWVRRERPPVSLHLVTETSFSFPSGHAVFSGVMFGLASYFLLRDPSRRRDPLRLGAAALIVLVALGVASSRVWLGVHHPTDVLYGFTLGLSWSLSAAAIRSWAGRPASLTAPPACDYG